ncbi:hypothetical protein AVEN_241572-1 [Araneus ventricosus]|uniref:Uncharacterized protein n=1 Tax=Araneus ventricosus TaxID=182803 RepID=A0A4Y2H8C6_ARAVE|nr:hypothetical protein AVEN_241572-1 [Araneus ventricosus]
MSGLFTTTSLAPILLQKVLSDLPRDGFSLGTAGKSRRFIEQPEDFIARIQLPTPGTRMQFTPSPDALQPVVAHLSIR